MLTKEEIQIISTELTMSYPLLGMLPKDSFWSLHNNNNKPTRLAEAEFWLGNLPTITCVYFLLILEAEGA